MSRRHPLSLPTFPESAPAALADAQLRRNLKKATSTIRAKRAAVAAELPDWEALRSSARAIKEDVLANLDLYLDRLEESVARAGGRVHRASDAQEANRLIGDLVEASGARRVVKVKSITTDEIGMNDALAAREITAVETDLAELIIQLAQESSSHFLVPAIHKNRTQIRDLFRRHLNRPELSDEPAELAEAARLHLRAEFLKAEVAVSGANFAVAQTGTLGVVESEGNGRMCLTLPRVLITLMGIEKVLPAFQDLEVFLQLLPRSATGERMNPYTSLWTGVTPGDGPQEVHLVLLDNGRRRVLADPVGRQALHCIRCSACLNTCPVYSRVGGHAYHATYPGPIGSILTPQLLGPGVHDSLPFASTLCGACAEVCPVKIEIPRVLLHLRGRAVEGDPAAPKAVAGEPGRRRTWKSRQERWLMKALEWGFRHPTLYGWGLRAARVVGKRAARDGWVARLPGYGSGWTLGRDVPPLAEPSFREWWERERGHGSFLSGGQARGPSRSGGGLSPPDPERTRASTGRSARDMGPASGQPAERPIPREYRVAGSGDRQGTLERFVERVQEYGAAVRRCPEKDLSQAIAEALVARRRLRAEVQLENRPDGSGAAAADQTPVRQGEVWRLAVPEDLPASWIAGLAAEGDPLRPLEILPDTSEMHLSREDLDRCHGVLTGCALAIAETGTLALTGAATQGRRALTLLPDYHLCVVLGEQVVETVPEGVRTLMAAVHERRSAVTFVSGPSATSDIELNRVEGVHGPRTLEVILVEGPS